VGLKCAVNTAGVVIGFLVNCDMYIAHFVHVNHFPLLLVAEGTHGLVSRNLLSRHFIWNLLFILWLCHWRMPLPLRRSTVDGLQFLLGADCRTLPLLHSDTESLTQHWYLLCHFKGVKMVVYQNRLPMFENQLPLPLWRRSPRPSYWPMPML